MDLIDGKYEVIEKIRDGGMGSIYKVRHVLLGEIRVMKTLRGQFQHNELARQRFFREARLATSLRHPNIAAVYDFSETPDHSCLMIMEYIDGQNLAELLSLGPPPIAETLAISIQALDALGYLHRKGIVHRDVSPDNLMVTKGDRGEMVVKLIDLGVARGDTEAEELTATGMLVGKLNYISPEQLGALGAGERLDGRSDLYSFGCVLYRLLTGVHAVEATTLQSFIMAHVHKPPRPFEESDPHGRIPADLRNAVNRALAKDRRDRWETADEFRDALRPIRDRLLRHAGSRSIPVNEEMRTERLEGFESGHVSVASTKPPPPPESSVESSSARRAARRPAPLGPILSGERTPFTPEGVPARTSAERVPASNARNSAVVWSLVAGTVVALLVAVAAVFVTREPARRAKPPGSVSVSIAPWGRVISVRTPEGQSVTMVPEAPVPAPTRLSLAPGSYVVVVRGPVQGAEVEKSASVVIKSGADTPLRITLPGFDVEELIRSYVH